MIGAVAGFFPSSIGYALPSTQRSRDVAQQPAVFAPSGQQGSSLSSQNNPSFADKLQNLFTLSPSGFSSAFSDAFTPKTVFAGFASAAYNQSNVLTANRLSVNV